MGLCSALAISLCIRCLCLHRRSSLPWHAHLCALVQDLSIVCVQAGGGALVSAPMQICMLLDGLIFRKMGLRLEFSYLRMTRSLIGSAREMGLSCFLVGALLILAWNGALSFLFPEKLSFALLGMGGLGAISMVLLPAPRADAVDNVFLFNLRKRFCRSCARLPPPLFRSGFSGEKVFDIDMSDQPHLIFLFIESFRAKNIGCLNGGEGASPQFDKLAREGILFTHFYANGTPTLKALISSLYGLFPEEGYAALTRSFPLRGIPQLLRERGYQTGFFHNGDLRFDRQQELLRRQGFDLFVGREQIQESFPDARSTSWGVHDEYLMRYSIDWLKKQKTPSFLTLLTISNHHPWLVPPEFGPPEKDLYRRFLQSFHYSDFALGLFMEELKRSGLSQRTVLFILGDHGYPLGEHRDNFTVHKHLYEENLHIPLLILAEGRIGGPQVISDLASQVDLLPTLMDLMHLRGVHPGRGESLVRKIPERTIFFQNPYAGNYYGCRRGDDKYVLNPRREEELYDLRADPEEICNLEKQKQPLVQELREAVTRVFCIGKNTAPSSQPILDLANALLSDRELEAIAEQNIPWKEINLSHCLMLTERGIGALLKRVSSLQKLHLKGLVQLAGGCFTGGYPNLRKVDLLECAYLTEGDFIDLLRRASDLQELYLTCPLLTDEGLRKLAQLCPRIHTLFLQEGRQITSAGIRAFSSLKSLTLDRCPLLVEAGFKVLALEELHLIACPHIEGKSLAHLAGSSLRVLTVMHCPRIALDCIEGLRNQGLRVISDSI